MELNWGLSRRDAHRIGSAPVCLHPPFELLWKIKTPWYAQEEPVRWAGTVFLVGLNVLVAVELGTGAQEEIYKLSDLDTNHLAYDKNMPGKGNGFRDIAVCGDGKYLMAHAPSERRWYCLGIEERRLLWKKETGHKEMPTMSPPVCRGDSFWWASQYPAVVARWHLADGRELWRQELPDQVTRISLCGTSLLISGQGGVSCLDSEDGRKIWRTAMDNVVYAPVGIDSKCLVSDSSGGLFALDTRTGKVVWEQRGVHRYFSGFCVWEDRAYIAKMHALCAISIESGITIWENRTEQDREFVFQFSSPVVSQDHIVIGGGQRKKIYVFSRENGNLVWEYPTKDIVSCNPVLWSEGFIIGSHDKHYFCFKSTGSSNDG